MNDDVCGIYEIICNVTDAHYIGKAVNIKNRWKRHKEDLRTNKHHSAYLQRSWNKHGERNFTFTIIEEVAIDDLNARELHYLATNPGKYNMLIANSTGVLKHSEFSRNKMAEGQISNWQLRREQGTDKISDAHKAAISRGHIGLRPNDATRLRQSISAIKRGLNKPLQVYCKKGHLLAETRKQGIGCGVCDKIRKTLWMRKKRNRKKPLPYYWLQLILRAL